MNNNNEFKVGQVWQYDTRKGEEQSLVHIIHIDEEEGYGEIYHIYVDNLAINNPYVDSGVQTELFHAPVGKETLIQSIEKLVSKNSSITNLADGYFSWKDDFKKGEAGVFNISVKEIVQIIEDSLSRR